MAKDFVVTDMPLGQAQTTHRTCLLLGGMSQLIQTATTYKVVCTFDESPVEDLSDTALSGASIINNTIPTSQRRTDFIAGLEAELGKPYIWGENGPDSYDCSGYAQYALRLVGLDPPGDQRARDLYSFFLKSANGRKLGQLELPTLGDLAFYGHPSSVSHVSICLDAVQVIEAGGGDSSTTTVARAAAQGAMVRKVRLDRRSDLVAVLRPAAMPTW